MRGGPQMTPRIELRIAAAFESHHFPALARRAEYFHRPRHYLWPATEYLAYPTEAQGTNGYRSTSNTGGGAAKNEEEGTDDRHGEDDWGGMMPGGQI